MIFKKGLKQNLNGGLFDSISYKEGYSYVLTTEAIDASVGDVTSENITVEGNDAVVTQAVYDMSNQRATLTLGTLETYSPYYSVSIGGNTYRLRTEEILPETVGTVSLRGVLPSAGVNSAKISVYNATFETKTVLINGVNSKNEELSAEITVEAESVGITTVRGVNINDYTWTVSTVE